MAKIDEIKEILNTLRVAMSILAGVLVVLVGKIFTKFENEEFSFVFWATLLVILVVIIVEVIIINKISQKTKEIKEL